MIAKYTSHRFSIRFRDEFWEISSDFCFFTYLHYTPLHIYTMYP